MFARFSALYRGIFFSSRPAAKAAIAPKKPLHPVELDGLEIIEGLYAVDHPYGDGRHDQTCYARPRRQSATRWRVPERVLMLWNSEVEGPVG